MSHNYYNYHTNNNNNNRRQSKYSTGYSYNVPYNGNTVATGCAGHQGQLVQHPGWRYFGQRQRQVPQDVRSQVASSHHYTQIISSPCQVRILKFALWYLSSWTNVWILDEKLLNTPASTFWGIPTVPPPPIFCPGDGDVPFLTLARRIRWGGGWGPMLDLGREGVFLLISLSFPVIPGWLNMDWSITLLERCVKVIGKLIGR